MALRRQPSHKLVARSDVRRVTGLEPEEVLRRLDTQRLVCIDPSGRRSAFVRIPLALLTLEAEGMNDSG